MDYQAQALATSSSSSLLDLTSFLGLQMPFERMTNEDLEHAENRASMIMAALGLAGEAGEVADLMKKAVFHKHKYNPDKLHEELGDVQWYVARFASAAKFNLNDIMKKNIEKLQARYKGGFSHEASINRVA